MTLEEYFANISRLIQGLTGVDIERYEEQLLSATRGNLRLRLRFPDQALLEMSEAVLCTAGTPLGMKRGRHGLVAGVKRGLVQMVSRLQRGEAGRHLCSV